MASDSMLGVVRAWKNFFGETYIPYSMHVIFYGQSQEAMTVLYSFYFTFFSEMVHGHSCSYLTIWMPALILHTRGSFIIVSQIYGVAAFT